MECFSVTTPKTFVCSLCTRAFAKSFNLNRHIRLIHKVNIDNRPIGFLHVAKCQEKNCFFSGKNLSVLTDHLAEKHKIFMEEEELKFDTQNGFLVWKAQTEKERNIKYSKNSGARMCEEFSTSYYYCNRSGSYNPRGKGKRKIKCQGSVKINGHCTSRIIVSRNTETGSVKATFFKTHYGHDKDLQHLCFSSAERNELAQELLNGDYHCSCKDYQRLAKCEHMRYLISQTDPNQLEEEIVLPHNFHSHVSKKKLRTKPEKCKVLKTTKKVGTKPHILRLKACEPVKY